MPSQVGKGDGGRRTAGLEPGGWLPDVRARLEAIVRDEVSDAKDAVTRGGPDFGGRDRVRPEFSDTDRAASDRVGPDHVASDRERSDHTGSDRVASDRDTSDRVAPVAVFDFDNTLLCRDLGDAVLHRLVSEGFLDRSTVASSFSPSFGVDGERRRLKDGPLAYYEALQQEAVDQDYDPEPRAAAYAWAVQVMAGVTPAQVVAATKRAMDGSRDGVDGAVPFPYPEMVGLLGFLLVHGVRVFIVSATNVWTTRWAVLNVINPLLRDRFGDGIAIRPECIVGISVLMKEKASGRLVSDARLLGTDPAYRRLDADVLSRFELTPLLSFPVSTYAGKVGCLRVLAPGERPLLAAGDSDNDLPLLTEAKHRLWIARLEESILQQRVADTLGHSSNWLVQPVLTGAYPGFVPSQQVLLQRDPPACAEQSLTPWRRAGFLRDL